MVLNKNVHSIFSPKENDDFIFFSISSDLFQLNSKNTKNQKLPLGIVFDRYFMDIDF